MIRLLDCADYNSNCLAKNQTVDANPDIAGIGVIVGFLTTTCITFLIAFAVLFLDRYYKILDFFQSFQKNKAHSTHEDNGPYWRSPGFWSRVLSKNLLAFSDTQLLTGLAIQFTAMLQHCKLSVYHFQVVTELAFLTTVTHLLTVITLQNYFVKNKWINLPRIFFMLGNLALLGYTSFVAYSYDLAGLDLSSSLACFYKGERPRFRAAFGGKWATLLIGAIGSHATIIAAMYFWDNDKIINGPGNWKWFLYKLFAFFRTWVIGPGYAIYGLYMGWYSLRKTHALGTASINIDGSEREWGFGQFLPVLLLALPLFAGWESFWEEKDEDRENRFGTHIHDSRSGSRMLETKHSPNRTQHSTDNSVVERQIESNRPSPLNTPRQRSTSRASPSPSLTPMPSPHLSPPLSTHQRPRSPSRFDE